LFIKLSIFFNLTLILSISLINGQINCQNGQPTGTSWAMACDFKKSDLSNKQVAGADCASACAATSCFTHFTWTSHNSHIIYKWYLLDEIRRYWSI
jgi:hypothetical protein